MASPCLRPAMKYGRFFAVTRRDGQIFPIPGATRRFSTLGTARFPLLGLGKIHSPSLPPYKFITGSKARSMLGNNQEALDD